MSMFIDRVEVQNQGRRGNVSSRDFQDGCFSVFSSSSLCNVVHYSHFPPQPLPHPSFWSQVLKDRKNTHSHLGQHLSQQRTHSSGLRRCSQILQDVPEEVYRRPGAQGHL